MSKPRASIFNQDTIEMSHQKPHLSDLDLLALNDLKEYYKKETKKCVKLTGSTLLSEEEYAAASDDFKRLIEIPRKNNEPIYIMPELDEKKQLHPHLKTIATAIQIGQPYHTFVDKSLGEIWPMLLRLYYGLKTIKFKISIEQMHSMLKVCYWNELKVLKIVNFPLFSENLLLTENAILFFQNSFYFTDPRRQAKDFLIAMSDLEIPPGERDLLLIELNLDYFRLIRFVVESELGKNSHQYKALKKSDLEFFPNAKPYSETETSYYFSRHATEMFGAYMYIGIGFYKILVIDGKPCIMLPSQTMLKKYYDAVNPGRNLKTVRVLGKYSVRDLEELSDQNCRPVNLYAPGVSNPLVTHRKVIPAAHGLEHDDYHALFEATIEKSLYLQMTRAKNVLRKIFDDKNECTAEILRLLDRERNNEMKMESRFYELLKYTFCTYSDDMNSPIQLSSVIVLADMILNPVEWPCYSGMKSRLFEFMLPTTVKMTDEFIVAFEKVTQQYAKATNNNLAFIAILLLAHFHLNDEAFCKILLAQAKQSTTPIFSWRKREHGHLYPVLIISGIDYTFDKLARLNNIKRAMIWLAKKKSSVTTVTLKAGEIIISIPEFDDAKRAIVSENHGEVVTEPSSDNVAHVKIVSTVLKKPLRDLLGIDRRIILGKLRRDYLALEGMAVEETDSTGQNDKFQVTFPSQELPTVEYAASHWKKATP